MSPAPRHIDFVTAVDLAFKRRQPNAGVAVLMVGLGRLREARAAFGFAFAERIVRAAEQRIRESVRGIDHVVRLESGEFAVLLPEVLNQSHARLAAEKILRQFERPVLVDSSRTLCLVAVGAAVGPRDGLDGEQLLHRAAAALELATVADRRVQMASEVVEEPLLLDELRVAISSNAFALAFQPLVRVADGGLSGLEALARWPHPLRGMISPERFVPLAEHAGFASEFTRWSVNSALREFTALSATRPDLRCAVNLSSRCFADSALAEQIIGALSLWGMAPERLVLEVTETAVMEDSQRSARALHQLRDAGIGIALDDFGSGYSSFNYLRSLPATELKIDRLFVDIADDDAHGKNLLRAMVELAQRLGLAVVAEGVERAQTAELVREIGCEYAQGFYFGRPEAGSWWQQKLGKAAADEATA